MLVNAHRGFNVGCIDQAKTGTPAFIEPIGQKANAVVALNFEILAVGLGDIRRNQTLEHARLHPEDLALLQTLYDAGVPTVTLWVAGRPLYVNKELKWEKSMVRCRIVDRPFFDPPRRKATPALDY